ncbi:MAG: DUF167 domain-containing protein [Promethearchaeota archaeon]
MGVRMLNLMPRDPVWENEEGAFLRVTARPRSKSREFVVGLDDESLVVNLASPAREGKANAELLKRLSKLLGISGRRVSLVSGHKSKEKTVFIEGLAAEQVAKTLHEVTNDK